MNDKFKAVVLNQLDDKFSREIKTLDKSFFKSGDVLVEVDYSSLNYKDALILKNGAKLVKEYPHIPGIDFSGQVINSDSSDFKPGEDVSICLDVAANELNKPKTIDYYSELIKKYPIKSIEDPFAEDDWESWKKLTKDIGIQIVGDDLFATNIKRLRKGIESKAANAILVKLNQIGTVSETLDVINLAHKHDLKTIVSHRSGDSEDTFIADLAIATNSSQIKTGSLARSERVAKYNRLIRIEEELGKSSKMAKI